MWYIIIERKFIIQDEYYPIECLLYSSNKSYCYLEQKFLYYSGFINERIALYSDDDDLMDIKPLIVKNIPAKEIRMNVQKS